MAIELDHCGGWRNNGGVPQGSTMPASISQGAPGAVFAFLDGVPTRPCVMVHGTPVVEAMLDVRKLEEWVTTLEEVLPGVPTQHYGTLMLLLVRLQVALDTHNKQHQEAATEAPTEQDMLDYLAAYAAAMGRRS